MTARRGSESVSLGAPVERCFWLPWPPSVNRMWRMARIGKASRLLLSREGRAYREAAGKSLLAQWVPIRPLTGRLGLYIEAFPPDRRARDLDNLCKGLLDALQHSGAIRNDADIDDLHIVRRRTMDEGQVRLTLRELAGVRVAVDIEGVPV